MHLIAFGKKGVFTNIREQLPSAKAGWSNFSRARAHCKLLLLVNKTQHLSSYLKVISIRRDKGADSWIFSRLTHSLIECFFVVKLLKRWSNHCMPLKRAIEKNNYINPVLQLTSSFVLMKQSIRNHCLPTISFVISVKPTFLGMRILFFFFFLAKQSNLFHST